MPLPSQNMPTAYCPACDADVEVFIILDKGSEVMNCARCSRKLIPGMTREDYQSLPAQKRAAADAAAAAAAAEEHDKEDEFLAELASVMDTPAQAEAVEELQPVEAEVYYDGALGTVLVADDEKLVRSVIGEIFLDQGVASEIVYCGNGGEVVKEFTKLAGQPVGLLVLDLEMPILNGLQTAMAVRKLEQARSLSPVPILFFSGRKREKRLDEAMRKLGPSMYMFKGGDHTDTDPRHVLAGRVRKVVKLLMREMQR
ncbi:MAG: response regulator [Chrysiogenetes bacterium]|nr:response regulator [Chrysiogenetes bacterium]